VYVCESVCLSVCLCVCVHVCLCRWRRRTLLTLRRQFDVKVMSMSSTRTSGGPPVNNSLSLSVSLSLCVCLCVLQPFKTMMMVWDRRQGLEVSDCRRSLASSDLCVMSHLLTDETIIALGEWLG